MRLPYRFRLFLATRPLAYWGLAVALAAGTAAVVQRSLAAAATERDRWGESRPTLVATRAVGAGDRLDPSDTEVRSIPLALRPDGTLDRLPPEPRPAVAAPLSKGEIVTAARLGRTGRSEVAGLLPDGSRGVAVTVPDGLPVRAGDVVDVVATAGVISSKAHVVSATDTSAVVAVDASEAPATARAAAEGDAVLVLSP